MERICVFGDSTALGSLDYELGGWVNRLWLFIAKQDDYKEIYNLSISGGTSETILERFENEAKVRRAEALIFQTGTNDSAFLNQIGNCWVTPEKFENNIKEIIQRAKKITTNIIFIGGEKCDETKTNPVEWDNIYWTVDAIKKYNEIMKEICLKGNVLFLDVFDLLDINDLEDGLHPNASGHAKIFSRVKEFLISQNWI